MDQAEKNTDMHLLEWTHAGARLLFDDRAIAPETSLSQLNLGSAKSRAPARRASHERPRAMRCAASRVTLVKCDCPGFGGDVD